MESCTSWSGDRLDEQALRLRDADWRQGPMLKFYDRRLEALFCEQADGQRHSLAIVICFFWAPVALAEFFYVGAFRYLLEHDPAAAVFAWSRLLMTTLLIGGGVQLRRRAASVERVIGLIIVLVPVFVFTNNEYRMSKIFGTGFYDMHKRHCGAETCMDDSETILILLITSSVPLILSIRVAKAWICLPWSVLLYAVFSLTGWGPLEISSHFIVMVLQASICGFLLVGTYRIEVESRRRFVENWRLRVENASQRLDMVKQKELLEEIEDRLEAMGLTANDSVARGATSHVTVSGVGAAGTVRLPNVREPSVNPWPPLPQGDVPNAILVRTMAGRQTDAKRLSSMASHLRDPEYGTREFFEDCVAAFPELELFFVGEDTSSGNSGEVEYQRTIGALFAVYWMLRSDMDGKRAFSFGVDDSFRVHEVPPMLEPESLRRKRSGFLEAMDWRSLEELVRDSVGDSQQRIQAMLCLTAFHDIMKVEALLPRVQSVHAPYEGYDAGDTIYDHDLALAYVLEYFPEMLPSYRVLPKASRELILFTQSKMSFNHGWFVQAESTPGLMLSKFKSVLKRASPADLAFYFFHWVTDLSGAEGRPMAGAEKFVVRFPQAVLCSFLWSIPYLERLTSASETEVVETYLAARFQRALPDEVAVPEGHDAIAIMRLVVMAQRSAHLVLEAFPQLPSDIRRLLAVELARTGMEGQQFVSSPQTGGPALFVYYGPAILQCCKTVKEMIAALRTVAALYHAGRQLWPLKTEAQGQTVTLEAGELKANASAVVSGQRVIGGRIVVLERRGNVEGVVSLVAGDSLNALVTSPTKFVALDPDSASFCADSAL